MNSILSRFLGILFLLLGTSTCTHSLVQKDQDQLLFPNEKYLKNISPLTFTGINTRPHWSFNGQWIVFQHQGPPLGTTSSLCDSIYIMKADGTQIRLLSQEQERAEFPFFLPKDEKILFSASTQSSTECIPDFHPSTIRKKDPSYQIYTFHRDGSDTLPIEPGAPRAYQGEASVCQNRDIIFTSDRDGNPNLYRAKLDNFESFTQVERITQTQGYDGGAVFSPDCKKIAWHSFQPKNNKQLNPSATLEIWVANADGTHAHPVTELGASSFSPTFTKDGNHIVFASNLRDPKKNGFDLYRIPIEGTGLLEITHSNQDSFPMFSPDRKKIVFSSTRNAKGPNEIHIFIADWEEPSLF